MKYYIFILGCQYNYYDAKRIAHLLEKMGCILSSENEADLIIVLACSVRQRGVDRIFGKIRNWNKLPQKPKIIISACILESDKKKLVGKVEVIVDTQKLEDELKSYIVKQLESSKTKINNNQPCNYSTDQLINFLPLGESKQTTYVPIMQGCDNFCTYCAVPYTRGREVSRSENEVIAEVKKQLQKGFKKIILLGQNVNSYGRGTTRNQNSTRNYAESLPRESASSQRKSAFILLLEKIDHLPNDFTYNFMSSNPHDFTNALVKTLSKLKKWEKVLHLPMQSGDDEILRKMNRKYNSNKYYELIANLKSQISNLQLTTDIIVGFPTETKKQFQNTVKLCKKIGFNKAYISQYSPRPDTLSAREMNNDVPKDEKKRRWIILNDMINKKRGKTR